MQQPTPHPRAALAFALGLLASQPAWAIAHSAETGLLGRTHSPYVADDGQLLRSGAVEGNSTPALQQDGGTLGDGNAGLMLHSYAATGSGGGLHLHTAARADVYPGRAFSYGTASAGASISDTFVFSGAAIAAGTPVLATVAFDISGSLSNNAPFNFTPAVGLSAVASSEWRAGLALGQGGVNRLDWEGFRIERLDSGQPSTSGNAQVGRQTFVVQLNFGTPVDMQLRASTVASASVDAMSLPLSVIAGLTAHADALFDHTFAWGGVLALTDLAGTPITGYTAISASSGVDYALPYMSAVPEPGPAAMLAAGLLVLLWRGRRSSRA